MHVNGEGLGYNSFVITYQIHFQVCTLELLKQRFGEGNLHFCEVMLKDVGDSKRICSAVSSKTSDLGKVCDVVHQCCW